MTPTPNWRQMRVPVIVTTTVVLAAVAALIISKAVNGTHDSAAPRPSASQTVKASASPSASIVLGTVVTAPQINGSAYFIAYADGPKPEMVNPDDRVFFDNWLAPVLAEPLNLRNWQLCPAELNAEARATQAYVDAVAKFPRDMPYDLGEETKNVVGTYSERAQTMRSAAKLAEQNNIACIDEPTSTGHWLQFTLLVHGAWRKVVVPDGYILLFVFETGEQIVNNPNICVPHTHERWEKVNRTPVATTVSPNSETFSERSKYAELEQLAAEEDLERAMGRATCPTA